MIDVQAKPNRSARRARMQHFKRSFRPANKRMAVPAHCEICHKPFIATPKLVGRCSCKVK